MNEKGGTGMSDNSEKPADIFIYDEHIEYALCSLTSLFEMLIDPVNIRASIIQALARIILLLRRMPYITPNIYGYINIYLKIHDGSRFFTLSVSERDFELSGGGTVYNSTTESDTYSSIVFYMTADGFIEGTESNIYGWIYSVKELISQGATIDEEGINDTANIDWNENPSNNNDYHR